MISRIAGDLLEACERSTWEVIYGHILEQKGIQLSQPNNSGECRLDVPFPFVDDTGKKSFAINILSGLWRDFKPSSQSIHKMQGGNIVQFLGLMNAIYDNKLSRWTYDFNEAERGLRFALNIAQVPQADWYNSCIDLLNSIRANNIWYGRKPWNMQTLISQGIGYDRQSDRLVIPLRERNGKHVGSRFYNTTLTPKMHWGKNGISGNILLPHTAWDEDNLILVEGEPDYLTLRSYGFNGISGTMGSGNPVPSGEWHRNKTIFICMDVDAPGVEAEKICIEMLKDNSTIKIIKLPDWDGRPDNADISDYIMHLISIDYKEDDIKSSIQSLLNNAITPTSTSNRAPAVPITFAKCHSSVYMGINMEVKTHVVAKMQEVFAVPERIEVICPAGGHAYCSRCPMINSRGRTNASFDLTFPSVAIKFFRIDSEMQRRNIMEAHGVPNMCPDYKFKPLSYKDVEVIQITSTQDERESVDNNSAENTFIQKKLEVLVLKDGEQEIVEGADYEMIMEPVQNPKNQSLLLYAKNLKRISASYTTFDLTEDKLISMSDSFICEKSFVGTISYITNMVRDLSDSVTGIYERDDLHIAYLLTWFSQLEFYMRDILFQRGYVELFVMGDTACGKTKTFKTLRDWLGSGYYVDRKMATAVGLIGAVEQSSITGNRYVSPGIMPRNDGLGPIMIDEFGLSLGDQMQILAMLSSIRSEGIASINKAVSAVFKARCRSIYAANPGGGHLMSNMAASGVDLFKRMVQQPEDRRRFDIAMAVSQSDVESHILNTVHQKKQPTYSQQNMQWLLNWGRSRGVGRIKFTEKAYDMIEKLSKNMCEKYDHDVALVEPSDQKLRIAKISVSVATMCFSHEGNAEDIVVHEYHVTSAVHFMMKMFDGKWFGYDKYSESIGRYRSITNEVEVRRVLATTIPEGALPAWIMRMKIALTFRRASFMTMTPCNHIQCNALIQSLVINNCFEPAYEDDSFKSTGQFQQLLNSMQNELNNNLCIYEDGMSNSPEGVIRGERTRR